MTETIDFGIGEKRKRRSQAEVAKENQMRRSAGRRTIKKLGVISTTSVYMPKAVHDKLAEIVFHRRDSKLSQNDLILLALEHYLEEQGHGNFKTIVSRANAKAKRMANS